MTQSDGSGFLDSAQRYNIAPRNVNTELERDRVHAWLREFASVLEMAEIQEDCEQMLRQRRRR